MFWHTLLARSDSILQYFVVGRMRLARFDFHFQIMAEALVSACNYEVSIGLGGWENILVSLIKNFGEKMGKILIELSETPPRILEEVSEAKSGEKSLRVAVKWQHVDQINSNLRFYPRALIERELKKLAPLMAKNAVYGCGYHPEKDAKIEDITHLWEEVEILKDGSCVGIIKVLPTTQGRNAQIIIRNKGWIGLSSRGLGTTTSKEVDGKKYEKVNDDYELRSPGDLVLSPSVEGAGIQRVLEARFEKQTKKINEMVIIERFHEAQKAGFRLDYAAYRKIYLEE